MPTVEEFIRGAGRRVKEEEKKNTTGGRPTVEEFMAEGKQSASPSAHSIREIPTAMLTGKSDRGAAMKGVYQQLGKTGWADWQKDPQYRRELGLEMIRTQQAMKGYDDKTADFDTWWQHEQQQHYMSGLRELEGAYQQRQDWFGQFKDENEYGYFTDIHPSLEDAHQRGLTNRQWYEEINAQAENANTEIEVLEDIEIPRLQREINRAESGMQADGNRYDDYKDAMREAEALKQELQDAQTRLNAAYEDARKYGYQRMISSGLKYADLPEAEDWESGVDAGRAAYETLQANVEAGRAQRAAEVRQGNTEVAGLSDEELAGEDYWTYRMPRAGWTEDELNTYYYLLNKDEEEAAQHAIETNQRHMQQQRYATQSKTQDWAHDNLLLGAAGGTVSSVLTSPLALWDWLGDLVQYGNTGLVMPRAELSPRDYANMLSAGAAAGLNDRFGTLPEDWAIIGGKGWGDAYQLANSIGESMAWGGLTKAMVAAGAPEWLGAAVTNLGFFGNAAAETTQNAITRGASPEQALWLGAAAGAAEALGETVSVEKLIHITDTGTMRRLLWNALKQGGIEASEEAFTTLINTVADAWIMGDKSEYNEKVRQNILAGMTREEAEKAAWQDWAEGIAQDALGGFLSGGVSGVVYGSANMIQGSRTEYSGSDREALLQAALQMDPKGKAYQLAQKIQQQGTMSYNEALQLKDLMGERAELVSREVSDRERADIQQRAETALRASGVENPGAAAQLIAKEVSGEKLTREERRVLKGVQQAEQVSTALQEQVRQETNFRRYQAQLMRQDVKKQNAARKKGADTRTTTVKGEKGAVKIEELTVENGRTMAKVTGTDGKSRTVAFSSLELDDYQRRALNTFQQVLGRDAIAAYNSLGSENIYSMSAYDIMQQAIAWGNIRNMFGAKTTDAAKSLQAALASQLRGKLSDAQVEQAFEIGRKHAQEEKTERPKSKRGTGHVSLDGGTVDGMELKGIRNKDQVKRSKEYRAVKAIAKALGIDVVLFESEAVNKAGDLRGIQGAYLDGVIYLDWNAGMKNLKQVGSRMLLRTMSHELTHFIQQNAPELYEELKDYVTGYLADKMGADFNDLVAQKMAGRNVDRDGAIDEVVADACETMLRDSQAVKDLVQNHRSLWQSIKDFVLKYIGNITAEDPGAIYMQDTIQELQEIWGRGLKAAVENRTDTEAASEEMKAEVLERGSEALTEIDPTEETATVTLPDGAQHSIRSMRHDIAEGKMFEDLEKYTDMSHEEVQELKKNLEKLTDLMALHRDILDMNETFGKDNRTFKPFKPNSDPLYTISLDFSTLCRKRLMTQYVIEKLQTELTDSQTGKRGRPLTAEEQLAVRDLMKEYAQQEKALKVACAMCYVEAARLKAPSQIQRFMRDPTEPMRRYFALRNSEFNASVREAQADFKEQRGYPRNVAKSAMKPADVTALNKLSNQLRNGYQMSAEEQREIEIAKALPNETYLTAANLANLAEEHPVIYDAYTATIRTATRSKSLEADIPYYYGDSEGAVSDKFIEDVNRENGMRFSSWSDFQIQHMLDMMTAVIELSVRHCAMHGYTKFLEQVRIFGKTGMMFNMSGVPSATGLKADGSLDFSTTDSVLVHGQDGEYDAVQAREDFPETAGLQCIGMSNKHIMALLASDIMDYIIPYHTSGMNATLRRMAQIYSWDDFTPFQNAKVDDRIKFDPKVHDKSTWHQEPVFSEFFNAAKQESNGYRAGERGVVTMRRAADLYKQMCRERGMMPKFSWGNSKVDADFSNDPNYWKLLIDRKMINQKTGALIEQKPVRPDFDFKLIEQMVQAEVDAYDPTLQDRALNYVRDHLDELPQRITDLKKAGAVKKITGRKTNKAAKTLQAGPVAAVSEANAAGVQLSTRGSWNSLSQEEKDQAVEENRAFNESQTKTGSKLVTLKGSDISRGGTLAGIRYPVGKVIGGRLYIHKSYADTIGDIDPKFRETLVNAEEALREEYPDFQYNCINYHPASGEIQFQEAPDFDTAREPVVGMQINVQADGTVTEANRGKPFQQIWHHKWQWVGNDYKGFNVRQSWEWSKEWLSTILGASKGGSMRAWNEQLAENGLPEDGGTAQFSARPVSQQFSSEDTSINQNKLPGVFTKGWFTKELKDGGVNIDIGGGKYDNAAEYLKQYGVTNMVFDPFNRNRSHNKGVLDYVMSGKRADTVTCANVLNVIQEPAARENVILECAKAMKPDGKAFFLIYEGDKTGNGRTTKTPVRDQNGVIQHDENGKTLYSTSWQEHRDAKSYLEEIKQYFDVAVPHGNLIVAEKPKADLPQAAWQLDKEGETVQFSVRSNGNLTSKEAIDAEIDRLQDQIAESYSREGDMRNDPEYRAEYESRQAKVWDETVDKAEQMLLEKYGREEKAAVVDGSKAQLSVKDAEYVDAVKRGDMDTAQRMVDEAANEAGYTYRRYTHRKLDARNSAEAIILMFADKDFLGSSYGENRYAATGAGAIEASKIMPDLLKLARNYLEENGMDSDGLTEESLNPADIVDAANMWDDIDFVQYAWDNYFEELYQQNEEIPALKTADGMLVFGEDYSRIKSLDPVTYDDKGNVIPLSERFDSSKSDIRYSVRGKYKGVEEAAIQHFGTTDNFRIAGYILQDGKMLDFSGAHWLDGYDDKYIAEWRKKNDIRQVDHEDVYEAFEQISDDPPSDAALAFINGGNIRVVPEVPGLELSGTTEPTAAQYRQIKAFIREIANDPKHYNSKYFSIDITKDRTHKAGALKYEGNINADRVVNDIKHYYQTGEIRDQGLSAYFSVRSNAKTDRELLAGVTAQTVMSERLQQENEILRESVRDLRKLLGQRDSALDKLRRQLRLTKSPELRLNDAKRMTRSLLQDYDSRADAARIAQEVKELGEFILGTELTGEAYDQELDRRLGSIARQVVENAKAELSEGTDVYKEIASRIKGKKISVDAGNLGDLGDFGAFRKSLFGKLIVSQRAANTRESRADYTSADQLYAELQADYGETIFPTALNEGEELQNIARALENAKPTEANPFAQDMQAAEESVRNRVLMDLYSGALELEAPTAADRAKSRRKALQDQIKQLQRENRLSEKESQRMAEQIYALDTALDKARSQYETLLRENAERRNELEKYRKQLDRYEQKEREVSQALNELDALVKEGTDADAVNKQRARLSDKERQMTEALQAVTKAQQSPALQQILQRERAIERTRTRERIREGVNRRDLRGKINRLWKDLNQRITNPTEKNHIPVEVMQQAIEVLQALNMDTSREGTKSGEKLRSKLTELRQRYDELKNDKDYLMASRYDEYVNEMLGRMVELVGDTPINKMSFSQMEAVYDTLKALDHVIKNKTKIQLGERMAEVKAVGQEAINETRSVEKARKGWLQKYFNMQLSPERMFNRLGGYHKNSVWSQLYRMLNDGQLRQTQLEMEGSLIFDDLINSKEYSKQYKDFVDPGKTVDVGLKDKSGNAVKLTHGMMVSLWMHLQNEQNRRHVAYGGLTIPGLKDYYGGKRAAAAENGVRVGGVLQQIEDLNKQIDETDDPNKILELEEKRDTISEDFSQKLLDAIEKNLTEYDKQWIAACREMFDGFSKRVLNETTMQVYGIKRANVENYFPLSVDKHYLQANFDTIVRDFNLENAGFMKERVESKKPVHLFDVSDVAAQQVRRVSQYAGMMPAIRAFNQVLGFTNQSMDSVQSAIFDKFGNSGMDYIEHLMADLNGARSQDTGALGEFFNRMRGRMAQASLTMNLRVALGQTASYPTAAAVVGWKALHKALWRGGRNNWMLSRADKELIRKWSPLLYYRMQGYRDTELGDIAGMNSKFDRVWKKARWLTGWIQAMDGATVGRLWYAAEYYVQDHNKDLQKGTDAYYEAVAKVFNDIVERTQPNYSTMQRPDILRNPNALVKQLTMFMTQRLQNFNILYDAAATYSTMRADYKAKRNGVTLEDVRQAARDTRRAAVSQVAAGATIVLFKALAAALMHKVNPFRDDDKELTPESVSMTLLDMFMDSMAGNVLFGTEVWDFAESKIFGTTYYGIELSGVGVVTDLIDAASTLFDHAVKGELSWKDADLLAKRLGSVAGIPYSNAKDIVMGGVHWVQDGIAGELFSFEAGVDRTTAMQAHRLYRAYQDKDFGKVNKIRGQFPEDKQKDLDKAVREYIRGQYKAGEITVYEAMRQLQSYGNASPTVIADFIKDEYKAGNLQKGDAVKYLVEYAGRSQESAEKTVRELSAERDTGVKYSEINDQYMMGEISAQQARQMLVDYGGKDSDTAALIVEFWDFQNRHPGTDIEFSQYQTYTSKYKPIGLSPEQYEDYARRMKDCKGVDADGDGKTDSGSKKIEVVALIDSMDLTPAQKDQMYLANNYAESGLKDCPWNK